MAAKTGENIRIARFAYFRVGQRRRSERRERRREPKPIPSSAASS